MNRIEKIAAKMTANALSDYTDKKQSVEHLLREIGKELVRHSRDSAENPDNYGYVGDLGHVESKLNEILRFLVSSNIYGTRS
jgi:hypothetical protein